MKNDRAEPAEDAPRFEFGRNWRDFVTRCFGEGRVEISKRHLLDVLGRSELNALDMVDIG